MPPIQTAAEAYSSEIRGLWKEFLVSWPPDSKLEIGDFGLVTNGIFYKEGNITKNFKINFEKDISSGTVDYKHASNGVVFLHPRVSTAILADSTGTRMSAGLDMSMSRQSDVFSAFSDHGI
jgi:hypothetical protein